MILPTNKALKSPQKRELINHSVKLQDAKSACKNKNQNVLVYHSKTPRKEIKNRMLFIVVTKKTKYLEFA